MNDKDRGAAEERDVIYGGAGKVVSKEKEHINNWRGRKPLTGIALSGGGIRSASFCLGALQALAYGRWLPEFDYLSTVSGGGYIGTSLSYFLHYSKKNKKSDTPKFDVSKSKFPYRSHQVAGALKGASEDGSLLDRLRQNPKYLAPGKGITLWSLIGVVLRNSVTSVFVYLALSVLILVFSIGINSFGLDGALRPLAWKDNYLLIVSVVVFGVYALLSVAYVPFTGVFEWLKGGRTSPVAYWMRRGYEQTTHWALRAGSLFLIVALLPWVHDYLTAQYALYVSTGGSILGILSSVWAYLQTSSVKKPKIPTGVIVAIASVLLLFGVLLLAFHIAHELHQPESWWNRPDSGWTQFIDALHMPRGWTTQAIILGALLFVFGWLPNANYVSVHRYYRDRLMETFMPGEEAIEHPDRQSGATWAGNATMIGEICGGKSPSKPKTFDGSCGPYHLINTNVVLVSSSRPLYRGRGGDNFIFSPLYTGSRATGWMPTEADPDRGGMTLATAMAISGAAVNPNTGCGGEGVTRQRGLSLLMSLLNIRLGYWLKTPVVPENS